MVFSTLDDIEQYVHFQNRESGEKYDLTNEGVIISEKTAKLLDAQVGDTIEIKDEEKGNKEIVIDHITENYMSHYMYMTKDYYKEIYGKDSKYNTILFSTNEEYTAKYGFMPPAARPAAKVTACSSAIPTSKKRLGYFF